MNVVQSAVFIAEEEPPVAIESQELPSEDSDVEPTTLEQADQDIADVEDPAHSDDESE